MAEPFKFRPLKAEEVECRIGTVTSKGATLLLYKTARTDMDILDETVGAANWQNDFYEIGGKLFCKLGLRINGTNEWVWKSDCGVEGNVGEEKSQASDARKRAGFAWGIGRELYRSPFIFAKIPVVKDGNRYKPEGFPRFDVADFESDGTSVTKLTIVDDNGEVVFSTTGKKSRGSSKKADEKEKEETKATKSEVKGIDPALLPGGERFKQFVSAHANGGTYQDKSMREVWANAVHATVDQIKAFDDAVFNYRVNNNQQ